MKAVPLSKVKAGWLYATTAYLLVNACTCVYVYDRAEHKLRYTLKKVRADGGLCVLSETSVLLKDATGDYRAYDFTTGKLLWEYRFADEEGEIDIHPVWIAEENAVYDVRRCPGGGFKRVLTRLHVADKSVTYFPLDDDMPGISGLYCNGGSIAFTRFRGLIAAEDTMAQSSVTAIGTWGAKDVWRVSAPLDGGHITACDGRFIYFGHNNTLADTKTENVIQLCSWKRPTPFVVTKMQYCPRHSVLILCGFSFAVVLNTEAATVLYQYDSMLPKGVDFVFDQGRLYLSAGQKVSMIQIAEEGENGE